MFSGVFLFSHRHISNADTPTENKTQKQQCIAPMCGSRCCAVLFKAEPQFMHKREETGSTRDFRTIQYYIYIHNTQSDRMSDKPTDRQARQAEQKNRSLKRKIHIDS